jgi:hypothetical protein
LSTGVEMQEIGRVLAGLQDPAADVVDDEQGSMGLDRTRQVYLFSLAIGQLCLSECGRDRAG